VDRIPILKLGDFLLVSVQVDMHDRLAMALQDDLTGRIVKDRARGVLIDISSLEIVDSFIGRMLGNIAAMARVLDAGGGDYPGRVGVIVEGRSHRAQRREGHGTPSGRAGTGWNWQWPS
jgi:hypothetical protein